MTDNEIRIISRKRKELFDNVDSFAVFEFIAKKETPKDEQKMRRQIESVESIDRMQLLDQLMMDMGYEWNDSENLYVEKKGEAKSEDDSADNEESCKDDENGEDCDACELNGRCPIQNADRKTETTIIHHHDEIKDKDFKRDLLNNPELRITVKGSGIAIIGEATTMKLMNLVCELLKIISKSGARAVRETIRLYNMKTTDKTLKLHLRREKEED